MFSCWKNKKLLSAYLEECLPRLQQRSAARHLEKCAECREELEQLRGVGALLQQFPAPALPADFPFRIRCRLSQEKGRAQQPGWRWRWANVMAPVAFPAAAGVLSALLIFGTLIHVFAVPVTANSNDVPLGLRTSPRLRSSAPFEFNSALEGLVVEVLIGHDGRVADYRVVAGSDDPQVIRNLRNHLLFTVFDPATLFGKPVAGRTVLSFQLLHVIG